LLRPNRVPVCYKVRPPGVLDLCTRHGNPREARGERGQSRRINERPRFPHWHQRHHSRGSWQSTT